MNTLHVIHDRDIQYSNYATKHFYEEKFKHLTFNSIDNLHLHSWSCLPCNSQGEEELENVVDNLDATEDGESSKETHRATNQTKRRLHGHLNNADIQGFLKLSFFIRENEETGKT